MLGLLDWSALNLDLAKIMECPICEYPNARLAYRLSDRFLKTTNRDFELFSCESCGLLFQPNGGPEEPEQFYPPGYWWLGTEGDQGVVNRYRDWVVRRDQLSFVERCVGSPQRTRLLDIGCGGGTFLKLALQMGFDAWGLEVSAEAVGIAQQRNPGRVIRGTESDLAARGEKYDLITLFHTLEHLTDPFRFLKGIQKLLNPGGRLVVQVPNTRSCQASFLRSRWHGLDCPRHIHNFSSFSVSHLLGRAGYRILAARHFSLRDNAPALVSSLFPGLDPIARQVGRRRRGIRNRSSLVLDAVYFGLVMAVQPWAWLEASLGRGATVTLCADLG